jgi:predicted amidohydrolase YtcJ
MGAAYVAHEENIKGSIEIGKLADITIWSQDPTGATPKELFDLPDIFMTINGGKIVHQA